MNITVPYTTRTLGIAGALAVGLWLSPASSALAEQLRQGVDESPSAPVSQVEISPVLTESAEADFRSSLTQDVQPGPAGGLILSGETAVFQSNRPAAGGTQNKSASDVSADF